MQTQAHSPDEVIITVNKVELIEMMRKIVPPMLTRRKPGHLTPVTRSPNY